MEESYLSEHRHDHAHPHPHPHVRGDGVTVAERDDRRRLTLALVLTALFFVAEVVGGVLSNSLALLADAGHMFTDVAALTLSLFVAWFSRQPATAEKTYGYLRWEVLAAFINGAALLLVSAAIIWEALDRFRSPQEVASSAMLVIALGGLAVNAVCAWLLHASHGHSINARGAYLHVLGDLLGSVGTVAAAVIIKQTGWLMADPIASIVVTMLVVRSAWRLVRESVDVLLEATPSHISLGSVRSRLQELDGVESVHDLHVWTVTSGVVAMSAHAIVPDGAQHQRVLAETQRIMQEFGVGHVTLQIEREELCEGMHP